MKQAIKLYYEMRKPLIWLGVLGIVLMTAIGIFQENRAWHQVQQHFAQSLTPENYQKMHQSVVDEDFVITTKNADQAQKGTLSKAEARDVDATFSQAVSLLRVPYNTATAQSFLPASYAQFRTQALNVYTAADVDAPDRAYNIGSTDVTTQAKRHFQFLIHDTTADGNRSGDDYTFNWFGPLSNSWAIVVFVAAVLLADGFGSVNAYLFAQNKRRWQVILAKLFWLLVVPVVVLAVAGVVTMLARYAYIDPAYLTIGRNGVLVMFESAAYLLSMLVFLVAYLFAVDIFIGRQVAKIWVAGLGYGSISILLNRFFGSYYQEANWGNVWHQIGELWLVTAILTAVSAYIVPRLSLEQNTQVVRLAHLRWPFLIWIVIVAILIFGDGYALGDSNLLVTLMIAAIIVFAYQQIFKINFREMWRRMRRRTSKS
ncbi:MAG TPA: hypothetical protein VGM95_05895 [Lactobacillaceae bacterium]